VKAALDATIKLGGEKLCILGWKRRIHEFAEYRYEKRERTFCYVSS
jgi:hypothetical protein